MSERVKIVLPLGDGAIVQAARHLVEVWRSPGPDAWRSVDDAGVVAAIEALCLTVESEES